MYKKSMSSYNHFFASIILEFQSNQFVNICSIVIKMEHNVMQLPVVSVWNTQLSIPTNGCLKIQNFILTRLRQLLVGTVTSNCATPSISLCKCLLIFDLYH